mmetsp:Transcript_25134/g.59736  ORF Transcript_25134/g.59736 Transcript_25134/m.59736 type:complete len:343 (-) Transcript_25134:40-1068(-)
MKFAATAVFSVLVTVPLVGAFSPSATVPTSPLATSKATATATRSSSRAGSGLTSRWMAADDNDAKQDGAQITSVSGKELKFDDKTGRFFETNLDECIPEEEFCTINEDTGEKIRLTIAEKERIFLDALQSYYATGRQLLPDSDFDLLKEDLEWNGSDVVVVNRDEAKFLAATEAYLKGQPIMEDKEFDALKTSLKEAGSKFAVDTEPKCYIDTGVCKVTLQKDNFRNNLLYLPAGAILSLVWLALGFEIIEPIIRLNPIILIALGSPLIYNGSKAITDNLLFPNNLVAYGPCPSCEYENRVYFGNILGVEGFDDIANAKCPNCKTVFTVQRQSLRASTLPKE